MTRWREVSRQNGGRENVSTVVVAEDEVASLLKSEAWLHLAAGWKVSVSVSQKRMVAVKGRLIREVFYREYNAMEDYESS